MKNIRYKKILFCTDFSDSSDYAFEFAHDLAVKNKGILFIMHVIPENPSLDFLAGRISWEDLKKLQKGIEKDAKTKCIDSYIKKIKDDVKFRIMIASGREDIEIINCANKKKVDIIVMGTHGRTGIGHVIFGSVAEKVLRHSMFPILIIPGSKD